MLINQSQWSSNVVALLIASVWLFSLSNEPFADALCGCITSSKVVVIVKISIVEERRWWEWDGIHSRSQESRVLCLPAREWHMYLVDISRLPLLHYFWATADEFITCDDLYPWWWISSRFDIRCHLWRRTSGQHHQPYRLCNCTRCKSIGVLGFFATDDGPNDIRGNYGILDQRLAIAWFKANIDAEAYRWRR